MSSLDTPGVAALAIEIAPKTKPSTTSGASTFCMFPQVRPSLNTEQTNQRTLSHRRDQRCASAMFANVRAHGINNSRVRRGPHQARFKDDLLVCEVVRS